MRGKRHRTHIIFTVYIYIVEPQRKETMVISVELREGFQKGVAVVLDIEECIGIHQKEKEIGKSMSGRSLAVWKSR